MKLEKVVTNKGLCGDIAMLSGEHQTSKLEAFHSLLAQFAPKMYVFSYSGMLCRSVGARSLQQELLGRRNTSCVKSPTVSINWDLRN